MDANTSPKPYSLVFEHRPEYLYALVEGEHDSLELSMQYWQEIADECLRNECEKVLVEENIPEAVSLSDVYLLVTGLADIGFKDIAVAFVDRFVEQRELNEFGALVGANRGINAKVFNDVPSAEKWLLSM